MKKVLANGCFDVLHVGHIQHLDEARTFGDYLIVALTDDDHVNKGEGRPVNKWDDRAAMLMALRSVDEVYKTPNPMQAIKALKPQVYVKGIDYRDGGLSWEETLTCREVGAVTMFTSTEKRSSTAMIYKITDRMRPREHPMWSYTAESLPPKGEVLAVIHRISARGEHVYEEAVWDGTEWSKRGEAERLPKNYYYAWRSFNT